jgi:16S rRNA processing protein RimM
MRRVTLGRVAGVFGIKGWVKVFSHTRPTDNLLEYPRWWVGGDDGYLAEVVASRMQDKGIVAQLAGRDGQPITDRDIAARLVGLDLAVERSELPAAPAGSWYWADLIGLEVVSTDGVPLGRVTSLMSNGAQDILVLDDNGAERLIPFVQGPIIVAVEPEAGRIVADWAPDY